MWALNKNRTEVINWLLDTYGDNAEVISYVDLTYSFPTNFLEVWLPWSVDVVIIWLMFMRISQISTKILKKWW